ncbi:hypothetical protein [Glutamicibacter sp.]|uniref:hypothetical protein n=1 Tax=Glutamicibacter sp. TaxID=1931995 RepID=UPI003D6A80AF
MKIGASGNGRGTAEYWARGIIPSLAFASAAAHFALAARSDGSMKLFMIAGGLLCFWCSVHPLLSKCRLRQKALWSIGASGASAIVHMGFITAHAQTGGHQHGGGPLPASAGGHEELMLGMVAFELALVICLSILARFLPDPSESEGRQGSVSASNFQIYMH